MVVVSTKCLLVPALYVHVHIELFLLCKDVCDILEAKAACGAGWQAVLVDRSMEQENGIELTAEDKQNFMIIDNLNDLFGEDDDDEEAYAQVITPRLITGAALLN